MKQHAERVVARCAHHERRVGDIWMLGESPCLLGWAGLDDDEYVRDWVGLIGFVVGVVYYMIKILLTSLTSAG